MQGSVALMRYAWLISILFLPFVSACSKDAQTSAAPNCPKVQLDAGDYWGLGMCSSGAQQSPCCPAELPVCESDAGYPVCIRATTPNSVCVCCANEWTCISGVD